MANAEKLPADVQRIDRQMVFEKALLLAEVGLRNAFGQPLNDALRDLAIDFYGGDPIDAGFDQLLRETEAGQEFALALAAALAPSAADAGGAIQYEEAFARLAASGPDFISFAAEAAAASLGVTVVDGAGRTLAGGPAAPAVPGGVVMPFGDTAVLGLITQPANGPYTFALSAQTAFSITFPLANGTFGHVQGSTAWPARVVISGSTGPLLMVEDADSDGTYGSAGDASQTLPMTVIEPSGPVLLSAHMVGPDTLSGASAHGLSLALLFDRVVDATTGSALGNYTIPANALVWAKRQLSGRFVLASLLRPEGPYVPSSVTASGITDGRGAIGSGGTVPLESLLTIPGAVVTGRVVAADGTPAVQTSVYLSNYPPQEPSCSRATGPVPLAEFPVSGDGGYSVHYVAQTDCGAPFVLTAKDPETTLNRSVEGHVRAVGERITLDIALIGRGSVSGTVKDLSGQPVPGASLEVRSLVDSGVGRNAVTDGDGHYLVHGLTVGLVEARAAKGISFGRNSGRIERAGETAVVDVTMDAGTVRVSGRCLRVEDGTVTPVAGALVVYSVVGASGSGAAGYDWTDGDGRYAMEGLPFGSFAVSGGGVTVWGQAFPNDDLTVDLVKEVPNEPPRGHAKGYVVFPYTIDGSEARAGGVVVAQDITDLGSVDGVANYTYTNANGEFDLGDLPTGKEISIGAVTLDRSRTGYGRFTINPVSGPGGTPPVADNVRIVLEPLGAAEFTVLDPYGHPIPNQEVRILGLGLTGELSLGACKDTCGCYSKMTGSNGRVRFEKVRTGGLQVKALRQFSGTMDVVNGSATVTREGETTYGVLRFAGVGTVLLNTSSPAGGATLYGGEYALSSRKFVHDNYTCDLMEQSSHGGTFSLNQGTTTTISGVNVGPVSVWATNAFSGAAPIVEKGVLVAHGDTLPLTIKWNTKMPGEITGRVLLPDGVTPAGGGVEVRADGPLPDVTVYTFGAGQYNFAKILVPGTYTLTVRDPATGGMAQTRVQVGENQSVVQDVRLLGRGRVTVNVTDSDGHALDNAFVTLSEVDFPKRAFEGVIRSGDQASVVFEDVFEGRVSVAVSDPYARGGRGSGVISAPGESITISVQVSDTGTVKGRFLRPDGVTPIPYATVQLKRKTGAQWEVIGRATTASSGEVGSFQFDYVPLGELLAELEDPLTLVTGSKGGSLTQNGDELYLEVVALGMGTVQGYVWQTHAGGAPEIVPNAQLRISSGAYNVTAFADDKGAYSVSGVPEGTVTVKAGLRGSSDLRHPLLFEGSATGELVGDGQTLALDVSLQETTSLDVHVLHSDGTELRNQPGQTEIAIVKLWLGSAITMAWTQTVPTEGGIAHFERVPLGTLSVSADLMGSTDRGKNVIEVTPAGGDFSVRLNGLGDLTVNVALATSGGPDTPVDGAYVLVNGAGNPFGEYRSATLSGSSMTFQSLPCGPVSVSASATPGSFALTGSVPQFNIVAGTNPAVTIYLQPIGTVHGGVWLENGDSGAGATVVLAGGGGRKATVQAQRVGDDPQTPAEFAFTAVPAGTYRLTIEDPVTGGKAVVAQVNVTEGVETVIPTIQLDATAPTIAFAVPLDGSTQSTMGGPLELSLADAGSGIDLSSLRVTYPNGVAAGRSSFQFSGTSASYQATATLSTSYLVAGANRLRASVADLVGRTSEAEVTFTVLGGTVSGKVTRGTSPDPIVGAQVRLNSQLTLTTDENGNFRQAGLKAGSYSATATDPVSGLTAWTSGTLADGGTLELPITLPAFCPVSGAVLKRIDNTPAADVTVTGVGRSVLTDGAGLFDLGFQKLGTLTIDARASNGDRAILPVVLADNACPAPIQMVLNGIGEVVVTVTDPYGSAPVEGAAVTVKSSAPFSNSYSGTTNGDGVVTFPTVLAGTLTVNASYAGYKGSPASAPQLTDQGQALVPIRLQDLTAPKVLSVAPANHAIQVTPGAVVSVTFDEPLKNSDDPAPGNLQGLIRLTQTSLAGLVVSGQVTLDASKRVATFTPQVAGQRVDLLQDATYWVRVIGASDGFDNVQTAATTSSFTTTDNQPPTLTLRMPTPTSWTSSARPTISITLSDAGSGVKADTATMTLDGTGLTEFTKGVSQLTYTPATPLLDGPHTVTATVSDNADNLGSLTPTGFGVDTTAPTVASPVVPPGPLAGTVAIGATATDDGSGVAKIELLVDGASLAPAVTASCSPAMSPCSVELSLDTRRLTEDTHDLSARATDAASPSAHVGLAGGTVSRAVNNLPLVTITAPAAGSVAGANVFVEANITENVMSITFSVVGGPSETRTGTFTRGVHSTTLDLLGLPHGATPEVEVKAYRSDGTYEQDRVAIVVDHEAPQINVSAINAVVLTATKARVTGNPGAIVQGSHAEARVYETPDVVVRDIAVQPAGDFGFSIDAALGNHIQLRAVDDAGNWTDWTDYSQVQVRRAVSIGDVPTDGMALWLDASTNVELVTGGNQVKSWTDRRTGVAVAFKPPTSPATAVPQRTDDASGFPVVRFDGVDDYLMGSDVSVKTLFVVLRADAEDPAVARAFVGSAGWDDFRPGLATIWSTSIGNTIKNGQTWLNDAVVDGTLTPRPTTASVISVVAAPSASAHFSWLGRDPVGLLEGRYLRGHRLHHGTDAIGAQARGGLPSAQARAVRTTRSDALHLAERPCLRQPVHAHASHHDARCDHSLHDRRDIAGRGVVAV